MKVTNYIWLAQGKLPQHKRISPRSLQRKVNDGIQKGKVQVICSNTQLKAETANALIDVDFNHELEHDPRAIFVIRSDSIDDEFLRHFLACQIPLQEIKDEAEPSRIILCEFTADQDEDIHPRFSEAIEMGITDFATSREELIRKIVELIEKMEAL